MSSASRPLGRRGSWFAEWEGKSYPCVHNHWRSGERKQWYDDPNTRPGTPEWDKFIEGIRQGVVIETKDEVPENDQDGTWRRFGYIALYAIDEFQLCPNERDASLFHLKFLFAKRLASFK